MALQLQELCGEASKFEKGDLIAMINPVLKHGGCVSRRVFEPQNIVLEVVFALGFEPSGGLIHH